MSEIAKTLLTQALSLDMEDQEFISNGLLDKLEGEAISVFDDQEYIAELIRRSDEVANGTAILLTHDEVMSKIQQKRIASQNRSEPSVA